MKYAKTILRQFQQAKNNFVVANFAKARKIENGLKNKFVKNVAKNFLPEKKKSDFVAGDIAQELRQLE